MNEQQQAQLDAIEHLLIAVLREHSYDDARRLFAQAESSVLDKNRSGDSDQKARAADYLNRLLSLF